MGRVHSYLNSAVTIIDEYGGEEPFASFLKKFFGRNKRFGSRDRKQIAHLCYCFFRLGKSFGQISPQERILTGLFLCSNEPNDVLQELKPQWNQKVKQSLNEKYVMLGPGNSIFNVFPWKEELSEGVHHEEYCKSFFFQPDVFLRLRPAYEDIARKKLADAGIGFNEINAQCLSLPGASKIEEIIELDKEAVIQDYSSQRIGNVLQSVIQSLKSRIKAWDCCAGSGGKSLLLHDIDPDIDLTVSDVRESILINLKRRFERAGIKKYNCFEIDLTRRNVELGTSNFELIIFDAPCTGSGTWSRTPEQLYFFDEEKIGYYESLQKKIVTNVLPHLKKSGYLVYSTCSVFKKENEEVVNHVSHEFNLEVVRMELLKGYDNRADTMYSALLRKL